MRSRWAITCLLAALCAAPAIAQQSSSLLPSKAPSGSPEFWFRAPGHTLVLPPDYRHWLARKSLAHVQPWNPLANTCFTMNSYMFARQKGQGDATKFVKHTTCTEGARFQVKQVPATPKVR